MRRCEKDMVPSFVTALAVVVALFAGQSVQEARAEAQAYPARPITFIATEVAGSATGIQARIIARGMAALLGQPIEIENIFGEPGLEKAIRAAPDGYTLVYGGTGMLALLPHIKKVSFDPLHDLAPAGRFVISPTLLAVNPASPANNVQELVALMKAGPGKLRMSTAGAGTTGHFAGELFIAMAGVKPVIFHYPGGGPAIDAVVSNDSQWTMAPIAGRLPHVRSGRLRARHRRGDPHADAARRADHRRVRLPGLQLGGLGRYLRAQRHAAADRQKAQRRHCRRRRAAGGETGLRRAGRRRREQHPNGGSEAAGG
jgi:tripartite-type tricarboxylate transporter receptor subunit TctC